MKVSITNLGEFAERHKQEPPFFTNREFNMIMKLQGISQNE